MSELLKSIENFYYRIKLLFNLDKIGIEDTGEDSNGVYVKLKSGKYFYGIPTKIKQHKYYSLLARKNKKIVSLKSLQTVYDIIIRYVERGLKLGGPKKEMFYKLKEGDVVAEMGAYMGYYTMYLSEKVGENGRIIAIEPLPDNLDYLYKNIKKNNINNITVVPKGVWNKKEKLTFFRKQDDHQSASLILKDVERKKKEIDVDSLDNILSESNVNKVDFMIIQLNGVEYEALEGLTKIKPRNISIAARYDKDNVKTSHKIKSLLEKRNYTVKIVNKDYVFAQLNDKKLDD